MFLSLETCLTHNTFKLLTKPRELASNKLYDGLRKHEKSTISWFEISWIYEKLWTWNYQLKYGYFLTKMNCDSLSNVSIWRKQEFTSLIEASITDDELEFKGKVADRRYLYFGGNEKWFWSAFPPKLLFAAVGSFFVYSRAGYYGAQWIKCPGSIFKYLMAIQDYNCT